MIVIDTSAVIAILLGEPECVEFVEVIVRTAPANISAVSVQEAGMIMHSRVGNAGVDDLFNLLELSKVKIVEYDSGQARLAITAFGNFG